MPWSGRCCFVMLRGVLSRPIERLVTLDRLLFMREAGFDHAEIKEIFDPRIARECDRRYVGWRRGCGSEQTRIPRKHVRAVSLADD